MKRGIIDSFRKTYTLNGQIFGLLARKLPLITPREIVKLIR